MGAQLRSGLPSADEKTITTLGGKIAIKDNYAVDKTGGSIASSTNETVIAQVQIPANSTISHLVIQASIRFFGASYNGIFKIRVGANGTTADAQIGNTVTLDLTGVAGQPGIGGSIMTIAISPADYTKTGLTYVSITGQNSANNAGCICTCYALTVVGV